MAFVRHTQDIYEYQKKKKRPVAIIWISEIHFDDVDHRLHGDHLFLFSPTTTILLIFLLNFLTQLSLLHSPLLYCHTKHRLPSRTTPSCRLLSPKSWLLLRLKNLNRVNFTSWDKIRYNPEAFSKNLNLLEYCIFELTKLYRLEIVNPNSGSLCYTFRVDRAIFSADGSSLLVIYNGKQLAILRLRVEKWTQVGRNCYCSDIMLYKGKFYAIDEWGQVVVIDSLTLE